MQVLTKSIILLRHKSIASFQSGLRSAVRGFWNGTLTRSQFREDMRTVINRRLSQAFDAVAKQNGLTPNDYSIDEQLWIGKFIADQLSYVSNLADDIEANSKAAGGKLTPLLDRTSMWVNRYNEVQSRAVGFFAGDGKYIWEVGPTDHCVSCIRLRGLVKRASFWAKAASSGIYPQSISLACKGYRCQCRLRETSQRVSRGPLPRI